MIIVKTNKFNKKDLHKHSTIDKTHCAFFSILRNKRNTFMETLGNIVKRTRQQKTGDTNPVDISRDRIKKQKADPSEIFI